MGSYKDRIRDRLLSNLEGHLQQLLPAGVIQGREFAVGDVYGSKGKSLKVLLDSGLWKDFATDEGGDIFHLKSP